MCWNKTILLFALVLYFGKVKGQDSTMHKFSFEIKGGYSKILAHRGYVRPLGIARFLLVDAAFDVQTNGIKDWHHHYKLPSYGISLMYCNFDNRKYLGNAVGLISHFNFKVVQKEHFSHYIKVGVGLGYIEKIFDQEHNFQQVAIGSHLNGCVNLQFNFKFLQKGFAWNPYIGLTHFSNAAIKVPNLGVNILSFGIGVSMRSGKQRILKKDSVTNVCMHTNKMYYVTSLCYGVKTNLPELSKRYKEATIGVTAFKPFSYKSHWGVGADVFYDALQQEKLNKGKGIKTIMKLGIHSAYALNIDKFAIIAGLGFYIFDAAKYNTIFYNRIGIRYHISNKFVIQSVILAHAARAHYLEAGIGYSINKK